MLVTKKILTHKLLGEILIEASLVSLPQLKLALNEQKLYKDLRIGEILALHGWLNPKTSDFFAEKWVKLLQEDNKRRLGYYLQEAGLLTSQQIKSILDEQKILGIKFGSVAILKGWLKGKTLEFFLKYLAVENLNKSPFIIPCKDSFQKDKNPESLKPHKTRQQKIMIDPEEIKWIG